ncbi:MAG: protein kinase, partial [Verrucomicrobiota bacterium]
MDSSDTPTDILAKDVVLQHGEEFGEYCVEDCVTSGLMGRIYRVLHMDNSEAYSICVLPHRASKDARLGGRLRRYAQQASELVHPNLVNIIEWKIIRGRFCLIMEPITGSSLQKVRRDKLQDLDEGFDAIEWETTEEHTSGEIVIPSTFGFGEQWAKEIVTNLVEVLTYLQEKRLAHSALSPDYIFVDSSGRVQSALGGLLAVLGRPLFEVIVSSEISPVNSATEEREINVIDVMSPEVQSGSAPTIKSDLYALGTLVYWMFTGRQFSALPTYVALGTFRPDVKEYWSEIADALLEADPEARLDSPSSLIYRMSEPEVNAAATDLTVDTEVEVAEEPEEPKTKTKRGPLIASLSIIALVVVVALGALVFMFSGGETAGNEFVAAVEVAAQAPEVPQWVEVAFESVAGAQILAIDEAGTEITLGSISDGGMLSVSEVLEAGTYRFQIQHENYQGITTEPYALTVEELVSVKVPLEPLPSQAEIWTIPNGAEIAVNGVARGQSPIRLTGLPSEVPLTITASLEGRRSESQSITLEPNSGVVIDFGEFEMQQAFIMPKIALSGET